MPKAFMTMELATLEPLLHGTNMDMEVDLVRLTALVQQDLASLRWLDFTAMVSITGVLLIMRTRVVELVAMATIPTELLETLLLRATILTP